MPLTLLRTLIRSAAKRVKSMSSLSFINIFAQIARHEGEAEKVGNNLALSKKILREIEAKYEIKRLFK